MNDNGADPASGRIAIIGMAGRFPGARDLDELWRNLRDGVESVTPRSDAELLSAGVTLDELRDPAYVKAAAMLDEIDLFDAAFFGLSPKDAAIMDPQHRLFLECAWNALEDAGWAADQFDGRIGVYAGSGMNTYLIYNLLANRKLAADAGLFMLKQTGNDKDVLATRVSYQLNLTGPSVSVQTACSSSLVAVHLAAQALLNHECDMALAGGVTIEVPHGRGYLYREGEILSRDGHCRPFDAESSGTIFGSGAAIVVVRRLEDAIEDGDRILAVIRATTVNNDGARKVGFLAPSVAGQAEVIAEAIALAGLDADSISYVEAHGTGTAVGDPIEVEALTRAFRETTQRNAYCALGSLKGNLGHLDAAAGVTGLIKTVLALQHRQLPPSINFKRPNPLIDFASSPFLVNTQLRDWNIDSGGVRRAGVTSLGIGGTNAHVIVEEAPSPATAADPDRWELITLSAKSPTALATMARNLADLLDSHPVSLADVAYTCHRGRAAFPYRRALTCNNRHAAAELLRGTENTSISQPAVNRDRPVIFMFPGQGAQYVGMARELFESNRGFRSTVDSCCDFLRPLLGLDLRDIIFARPEPNSVSLARDANFDSATALLGQTRLTQPALFVIEYALSEFWISLGIRPAAMVGHSVGEFAAACLAGVFSLEEAMRIVAERGRLIQSLPGGGMLAIEATVDELRPLLGASVAIASINAERQCVVAGSSESIADLEQELVNHKFNYRRLKVSHAFHSLMMDPIVERFTDFIGSIQSHAPSVPWVSSATGTWISAAEATSPTYWASQLRNTVRFFDGAAVLLQTEEALFLEVGPGRTLSALVANHPNRASATKVIASLGGGNEAASADETIGRALGTLWASGKKIDWRRFDQGRERRRVLLPTYPFERQRHWIEADQTAIGSTASGSDSVEALGGLFRSVWRQAEPASRGNSRIRPESSSGPWLIFADSSGLAVSISELIQRDGGKVVTIYPGEHFARPSEFEFRIDPANRADYDRLIEALSASRLMPCRILHFWCVENPDAAGSLDEHAEARSFWSLLYLAQALSGETETVTRRIAVVSNGLYSVGGEPSARPERAILAGPCAVIPKELPNLGCINIDVQMSSHNPGGNGSQPEGWQETARRIIAELEGDFEESPVAYRRNRRWIRTYEAIGQTTSKPIVLRDGAVHLITGGLGGIGLSLAEKIARSSRARIVLVSRTVLPDRAEWPRLIADGSPIAKRLRAIDQKLKSIELSGGEVLIAHADVTDEQAIRNLLSGIHDRFGPIAGVIHAAGVLADAPLLTKTPANSREVIDSKMRGALVLDRVLAGEPLEYFILISSVSALIAPAGQVDYVGANAFLDAFARTKASRNSYPVVAIQYPRWRDVGMAADRPPQPWHGALVNRPRETVQAETVFEITLSLERDWIVSEHRIKDGSGLFPGTGYIEAILAASAELFAGSSIAIRDLQFRLPLEVVAGEERRLRIQLMKHGAGYEFSAASGLNDGWDECTSAVIEADAAAAPAKGELDEIRRRCNRREAVFADRQNHKQQRRFDFGPRWRSLERIDFGRGEALATLTLPEAFHSDLSEYRVHPALLDMASGCAMFLIEGYETRDCVYLPLSYGRIRVRRGLPARCYSHIRARGEISVNATTVAFDIDILDEKGNLLIEIREFTLWQATGNGAAGLNSGFGRSINARAETEAPARDSITSSEGSAAFERILKGAAEVNVIVFPSDFATFAAKSSARPERISEPTAKPLGEGSFADEIEATLAGWWKELLGLDAVTPYSDFFQSGGQSLTAVRLFAKIKKAYGADLSAAAVYEYPTIAKLAQRIRQNASASSRSESTLTPIRRSGSRPPLYVFPDMNGAVIGFDQLVRRLSADVPVYGVEGALPAIGPVPLRLEEIAGRYVTSIRERQPHGPYHFLGYSFGGLVAFEVAQQIVATGEKIGLLGMLDTWQIGHLRELNAIHSIDQKLARRARKAIAHTRSVLLGPGRLRYFEDYIWARLRRSLVAFIYDRLLARYLGSGQPLPAFLRRPAEISWFAAKHYVARPYPGRITMFRATKGIAADDQRYGEALGWQNIASEGVEVHEVPGTHRDMLQEPNVRILAAAINAALTLAEPDQTRSESSGDNIGRPAESRIYS